VIEIQDTFRGGEDATLWCRRRWEWKVWRREYLLHIPLPSDYGVYEERPKLPQRGPVWSPGRKWILCVLSSTEHISDMQKRQKDQLHFDQLLELQRILTLNRDTFGTGFRIQDNSASRMTCYFFGTGPENSGLSRKIQDRWSTYSKFLTQFYKFGSPLNVSQFDDDQPSDLED